MKCAEMAKGGGAAPAAGKSGATAATRLCTYDALTLSKYTGRPDIRRTVEGVTAPAPAGQRDRPAATRTPRLRVRRTLSSFLLSLTFLSYTPRSLPLLQLSRSLKLR